MWFDSFDCASFVLRAFNKLGDLGTVFNQSVHLNYTRINLYSEEPQRLGNFSEIQATNPVLAENITLFYQQFQSHQSFADLLGHLVEAYDEIFIDNYFYLFYNYEYWYLPMKPPYMKLTYTEQPLPKPKNDRNNDETLYFKKHDFN